MKLSHVIPSLGLAFKWAHDYKQLHPYWIVTLYLHRSWPYMFWITLCIMAYILHGGMEQ